MKLLLNGGGSTKELELTINTLKKIIDYNKPILYVPLAMSEEEHTYDSCLEWFKKQISSLKNIEVDMPKTFEEFALKELNNYSAIFIGGGNTFKLLKGIKDNGIDEKIVNYMKKDGIIIGCSAGAIIFGYDINSCLVMDNNEVELKDTKGFNVLDGKSIFAHYTNEWTEEGHILFTNYLVDYSTENEPVIALPEEDTIYIDDRKTQIIGTRPYYQFKNGNRTKIDIIDYIPYKDTDYEFVYNTKKEVYKKYVEKYWKEWIEEDQQKHYKKFIENEKNNIFIIKNENKRIGFYNGKVLEKDIYEIGNICIIPEYQNKGIGSNLLKEIIEKNKDKDIIIQYFKNNPVGKLYKEIGFINNGETDFHYQMVLKKRDNNEI